MLKGGSLLFTVSQLITDVLMTLGVLPPQMVTLPLVDCPSLDEASHWPLVA